ncbi:MAG: hypothetical protein ACYC2T_07320 [Bacillota bacterium]
MSNFQDMIVSKGIRITAEPGTPVNPETGAVEWDAWTIHMQFEDRQLTVPFHKAPDQKSNKPSAAEVLVCLFFEASAYDNTEDFKHFCYVLGFDSDSEAEQIYKQCFETSLKLRDFLGEAYGEFEDALEKDNRG